MRIYIIGNDGITLCREPPAVVSEGEIVVASNEELHTVRLSGKRLLALWNALPDVEKRRKVGDRGALIDQLWLAIEALPEPQPEAKGPSKQDAVIAMLRRGEGATVAEVGSATGWQRHTVRGVFSGTFKSGQNTAMTGYDSAIGVDQHRVREAKFPDAAGDFGHLSRRMRPRIPRVRDKVLNLSILNSERSYSLVS